LDRLNISTIISPSNRTFLNILRAASVSALLSKDYTKVGLRFIDLVDKVVALGFHLVTHVLTLFIAQLSSLDNPIDLLLDLSV